ncbi:helix-turn-helix transcriptional regulator [Thalassiella azotivora]
MPGAPTDARGATTSPGTGLALLLETLDAELGEARERLVDVRARLHEAHGRGHGPEQEDGRGGPDGPDGVLEVVPDVVSVRARLDELSFFARRSIWSVQPRPGTTTEVRAAERPLEERTTRRRLDVRLLQAAGAAAGDAALARLRDLAATGQEVRTTRRPVHRLLILDGEVAVVPLDPGRRGSGALVVRQPVLVRCLADLFTCWWEGAEGLDADGGQGAPDGDDARVLRLLAEGCTDEIAARRLGISVRHLRRRVAALTSVLGARSRFEAGALAASRGWLDGCWTEEDR